MGVLIMCESIVLLIARNAVIDACANVCLLISQTPANCKKKLRFHPISDIYALPQKSSHRTDTYHEFG
ncbi:MAG: hypothetical protein Q4F40_10225, partial [Akkermansia sp.]|nr:hypothetical protein [Akkermansia sp.]